MRPLAWLAALLLLLVLSLQGTEARADDRPTARALGEAGLRLYEEGKYQDAFRRFEMAEALLHAPTLVLFMARCKHALGELVAARALYQSVVDEKLDQGAEAAFVKAQDEAKKALAELEQSIPSVQVELEGPADASVAVDGTTIERDALSQPIPLDPGRHEIVATAPGVEPARATVDLQAGGGVRRVSLVLGSSEAGADEPAEGKGGSLVPAGVCFGIGGAALAVGIATGIVALQKFDELEARCVDNSCAPEDEPLKDEVDMYGIISTVGIVVGSALVVAGIVLAVVQPGGSASAELRLGPGSLYWVGRF
jgi:hypothetical protein